MSQPQSQFRANLDPPADGPQTADRSEPRDLATDGTPKKGDTEKGDTEKGDTENGGPTKGDPAKSYPAKSGDAQQQSDLQTPSPAAPQPTSLIDLLWAVALFAFFLTCYSLGLGLTEFFRHTEADRTLVAWEMVTGGNFLVPHLLGSEILTKPPLYYWVLATAIALAGTPSEWLVRLPSAIFAAALVGFHFYFLRLLGLTRKNALLFAAVLATGIQFLTLSSIAEIDMLFGVLSATCLGASFLGFNKNSLRWSALAGLLFGAAILAKGPQIIFFFLSSSALLLFVERRSSSDHSGITSGIREHLKHAIVPFVIAGIVTALWLLPLAATVGWTQLAHQFNIEVLERITEESKRDHPPFFYVLGLLAVQTPWSVFLVAALVLTLANRKRAGDYFRALAPNEQKLLIHALGITAIAITSLSLAEGKSYRYLFPVVASMSILSGYAIRFVSNTPVEAFLFRVGKVFALVSLPVLAYVGLAYQVPGVDPAALRTVLLLFAAIAFPLIWSAFTTNRSGAILCLVAIMLVLRFGQSTVYAPHRNATRSVLPEVAAIHARLPLAEPIYTIEMFERWIVYYLKLNGREIYRLTPSLVEQLAPTNTHVYLLLTEEEELWRIDQLREAAREHNSDIEIQPIWSRRDPMLLVRVPTQALPAVRPRSSFPTTPTKPF